MTINPRDTVAAFMAKHRYNPFPNIDDSVFERAKLPYDRQFMIYFKAEDIDWSKAQTAYLLHGKDNTITKTPILCLKADDIFQPNCVGDFVTLFNGKNNVQASADKYILRYTDGQLEAVSTEFFGIHVIPVTSFIDKFFTRTSVAKPRPA